MITIDELKVQLNNKSRLIGIDMGSKRIGVCICDENRKIATPYETIEYSNMGNLISRLKEIISENNIKGVIFGLPLNMDGSVGPSAQSVKDKVNLISNKFSIGYTFGNNFSANGNSFNYSIFLNNSFSEKISGFFEFYGFSEYQAPTDKHAINFDFGGSYKLSDIIQVDAYFGKGFNNEMYFASVGFSYLFNKI